MRVLLLAGTRKAEALAAELARLGADAVVSSRSAAGAPANQVPPGHLLAKRQGGFGGVAGLIAYLSEAKITHVVDATDPFDRGMSRNAFVACARQDVPLIRLECPAWVQQLGDIWSCQPDVAALPAALPDSPARVFLALDIADLALFAGFPQHRYLLRLAATPAAPLPLPRVTVVLASGPVDRESEIALMRTHGLTHLVTKNTGGRSDGAKIAAARALGLPVILADRPALPGDALAQTTAEVLQWLHLPRRSAAE